MKLDGVGTGYALDAFGKVMAAGGAGVVISSQTGYMMRIPDEVEQQILNASADELFDIPYIKETAFQNSGFAYIIAKRINHLQAMKAAATSWKERRARINTISPGVIVTPLAYDEFAAAGDNYQKMIDASAAMRTGASDEIAEAGAFLLGEHAGFINGHDRGNSHGSVFFGRIKGSRDDEKTVIESWFPLGGRGNTQTLFNDETTGHLLLGRRFGNDKKLL